MWTRLVGIRAGGALLLTAGLGVALAGCAGQRGGRPESARPSRADGAAAGRPIARDRDTEPRAGVTAGGRLCRCVLLVPLAYNDGTAVPTETLAAIEDRLLELYGGYTVAGRVSGAYRMADGSRAEDESLEIWVAVPRERLGELRREVARIGRELRQESVYFEIGDAGVEFVEPETP